MARASFYVVVIATLNRVPLLLPILSLPGPEKSIEDGTVTADASQDGTSTTDSGRILTGSYEDFLFTAAGTCPHSALWEISASRHQDLATPPEETISTYMEQGLLGADGTIAMDYGAIENGGGMCLDQSNPDDHMVLGGMFFWETSTGECMLPPRTADGNACCEVYMWQPNAQGMYYGDCTMKMAIQPDGLYYFKTVLPGDEEHVGWGEDPQPHFHYDIECNGCEANDAFSDGTYAWWGKVYPEDLCQREACGDTDAVHQVQETSNLNGEQVYKYDFVLPRTAAAA